MERKSISHYNQNFPYALSNKIKCYKLKYCKGFCGFGSKILSHEERRRLLKETYGVSSKNKLIDFLGLKDTHICELIVCNFLYARVIGYIETMAL